MPEVVLLVDVRGENEEEAKQKKTCARKSHFDDLAVLSGFTDPQLAGKRRVRTLFFTSSYLLIKGYYRLLSTTPTNLSWINV